MASVVLQVRIDDKLKSDAEEIFCNLGLNMSSAVRLFLNRVVVEQGIPFPMCLKVAEVLPDRKEKHFDVLKYLDSLKEKESEL